MTTDVQTAALPAGRPGLGAVTRFGAGLAGGALLGVIAGLVWGEAAPRALLQQVSGGEATFVNAETRAFIGADAWFTGISLAAGLITGVIGYWLLIARRNSGTSGLSGSFGEETGPGEREHGRRAAAAAGLILGALAGAAIMMWIGGLIGLSGYQHALATSPAGATFDSSLSLGAKSALAFWPMMTAIVIGAAEWSARRSAE
jgi:hypothetical protein